jgi:hypothetical protein
MKRLLLILIICLWCGSAWGAIWLVDGTATDCVGESSCDTLAEAVNAAAAGDTIEVSADTTETATPTVDVANLIIKSHDTTKHVITASGDVQALYINNVSGTLVQYLSFIGGSTANTNLAGV